MIGPVHRERLSALLLIAACVAAYLPVKDCGFIWDDDAYVQNNFNLRTPLGLWRIWSDPQATPQYYPLVHTSFWIEYHLWGLKPLGYHLVNLALHIGVGLLWWMVLRRLKVPGAYAAALIFALHPVHVESVAWITERKNVLSGVFYLLAALAYFEFNPPEQEVAPRQRHWRWYVLALWLFIAALLSKSVTVTLPCALLLVLWWKRGQLPWREALLLAPFWLIGLLAGLHTAHLEVVQVGAKGEQWAYHWYERLLIAGRVVWFYAGKVVWPAELIFFYERWHIDATQWWQWVFPIYVVVVLGLLLGFQRRLGRGPATAALFFCGTLFPALGFFNVFPFMYSFVADHFQYLASMGVIALVVGCTTVALRLLPGALGQRAGVVLLVVAVSLLGVRTWRQIPVYRDLESLWLHVIELNPAPWMAHNNYGSVLSGRGQKREAVLEYQRALIHLPGAGMYYFNVGTTLMHTQQYAAALPWLRKATELEPLRRQYHYNLGVALMRLGQLPEAVDAYERALKGLSPKSEAVMQRVFYNLGVALLQMNRLAEARPNIEKAVELFPNDPDSRVLLGLLLENEGNYVAAEESYRAAIVMKPDGVNARAKLGSLLARLRRLDEARKHLERVLELDDNDAAAHANLGVLLLTTEEATKGLRHLQRAVEIEPTRTATLRSLAWTLSTTTNARLYDPPAGLKYARLLFANLKEPTALDYDTLAAALAANGQFEEATAQAEKALKAADLENRPAELREAMLYRWELYRLSRQAYRAK